MPIKVLANDKAMEAILPADQEPELIGAGFGFLEGPVWLKEEQRLVFNDIPASVTYSWSESNGITKAFNNGTKSNGMYLRRNGELAVCEHATSSVVTRNIDGTGRRVLADHFDGLELNSPNDIVERSDGKLYFSDPIFGRMNKPSSVERPIPSEHRPVYMYDPCTDTLHMVADGYVNPNGLCFSEDEKILYVNDSDDYSIKSYRVAENGLLHDEKLLCTVKGGEENHSPDGLKLDSAGNIVCAAQNGGIHWFAPDGRLIGVVLLENVRVVNFCWGGFDGKSMFLTCNDRLYRIRTFVTGASYKNK